MARCDASPKIVIRRVPRGLAGALATARLIADLIRHGARHFGVRQKAIRIFREAGVPAKDRFAEIDALFRWVQDNVRYTRDIFRLETLHTAPRMLELRAGDCDDMTILLGSMLESTGHPVRLCLAGFRRDLPHVYSHIYPEVQLRGRWIPVDASMHHPLGWAPRAIWKRICDIEDDGVPPRRFHARRLRAMGEQT